MGLLVHDGEIYDVMGVLPEGAKSAALGERSGSAVEVPLNSDDGYAITLKSEPTNLIVTEQNGSVTQIAVGQSERPNGSLPAVAGGAE